MELHAEWIGKYYPLDNFTEALVIGVYIRRFNSRVPELVGILDYSTKRPIKKK